MLRHLPAPIKIRRYRRRHRRTLAQVSPWSLQAEKSLQISLQVSIPFVQEIAKLTFSLPHSPGPGRGAVIAEGKAGGSQAQDSREPGSHTLADQDPPESSPQGKVRSKRP